MMIMFEEKANQVMGNASNTDWRDLPDQYKPIFSFDNAPIHTIAGNATPPTWWTSRALLPPHSPDMHKVIEHVFARMKPKFRTWLYHHPALRTIEEYMAQVEQLFWENAEVAGKEAIHGDVASLPATYAKVVEHRGGEIPKPYR